MSRDNMNISYVKNIVNKNLQPRNSSINNVKRNFEIHKDSFDIRFNPLINTKRNANKFEEKQTHSPKSYAATLITITLV